MGVFLLADEFCRGLGLAVQEALEGTAGRVAARIQLQQRPPPGLCHRLDGPHLLFQLYFHLRPHWYVKMSFQYDTVPTMTREDTFLNISLSRRFYFFLVYLRFLALFLLVVGAGTSTYCIVPIKADNFLIGRYLPTQNVWYVSGRQFLQCAQCRYDIFGKCAHSKYPF